MYAEHFGLRELPFNNTPDPRYFFSTPDHEEALASLIYAVQELKGYVLLTGEVGAGKTLIARMMLQHFGDRIAFANINHSIGQGRDLIESVCTEFGLEYEKDASSAQLVRILHDFLLMRFANNTPVALVIDEAQNLPTGALEQVRMIGNLEADDAKLLQVVIVGQPELQRRFSTPDLRQLRQRVFRSFHLPALTRDLTEGYIRHRLKVGGATSLDLFTAGAIERIYRRSQGLPRLINTICDNAMLSAYSAQTHEIDREQIESVVAQMMSIDGRSAPMPEMAVCSGPEPVARADSVVGLEQLAAQLAQIESRLNTRSPDVFTASLKEHEHVVRVAVGNARNEIETVEDELTRVASNLAGRLSVVEALVTDHSSHTDETREHDTAARRLADAEDTLARMEQVVSEATTSQQQAQRAAASVTAVVTSARELLLELHRTAAKTSLVDRAAQQTCRRITAQCERADRLVSSMRHGSDLLDERGERVRPSADRDGTNVMGTVDASSPAADARATDTTPVDQLLKSSQDSLSELRTCLCRPGRTGNGRSGAIGSTPHNEWQASDRDPPATRLAKHVQSLVELMEEGDS